MLRKGPLVLLSLLIFLFTLFLAGCASSGQNTKTQQVLRYNVGAEPKSIDPALAVFNYEATFILANFEGLTRMDATGKIEPGIAQKWDVSDDGKKYIFYLRKARWSNGDPVTAEDFIYAWTRVLDPKTASPYAYQLFYIKNAEKYNRGEVPAEKLGLKAIDSKTLEVELEAPTPYFLSLTSFITYMPVNKRVVEKNPNWANQPETYIGNGPFRMISWKHKDRVEWEKNPLYWDAPRVKLEKMTWTMMENETTELNAFESGQIDLGSLPPPVAERERLLKAGLMKSSAMAGTYFLEFNLNRSPLEKLEVREALSLAIDRNTLVKRVSQGGEKVARAWVPYSIPDANNRDFRKNGGNNFVSYDIKRAKELLAEAGYPGGKGFPQLTLLYTTGERHRVIVQAIQEMWKKNLGITINLQEMEPRTFYATRAEQKFDLARNGWVGDYLDAMAFLEFFHSNSGNNATGWHNVKYDRLLEEAKASANPEERSKKLHQAEKLLMAEHPIIPLFFYTNPYLIKPNVKGVSISPLGFTDFKEAYLQE